MLVFLVLQCSLNVSMQIYFYVRAVPRSDEYAVDEDAEGQQEELETSLQGELSVPSVVYTTFICALNTT